MSAWNVSVGVGPGDGIAVRRANAALYVDGTGDTTAATALVDRFLGADLSQRYDDIVDDIAELVVADPGTPAFSLLAWPIDPADGRIIVMVRGDLTVHSDLASMPSLDGASSPTWVEHRAPRHSNGAVFRVGSAAVDGTDLVSGIVPAGGLGIVLRRADTDAEPAPQAARAVRSDPLVVRAPVEPESVESPTPPSTDTADQPIEAEDPERTFGPDELGNVPDVLAESDTSTNAAAVDVDALAALGGDWMEESLQLRSAPTGTPTQVAPAVPDEPVDPETPSPSHAEVRPTDDAAATTSVPPRPTFEDDTPQAGPTERPAAPVVEAVMCPDGHPNAPSDQRCRRCELVIGSAAVVTVEQPIVATLLLPDGRRHPLAATTVIGRQPRTSDARTAGHAVELVLDDAETMSRTHCVVTVKGWNVTVTDCGSTSGTALLAADQSDPVVLDPWIAHEFEVGDAVFLGGPTAIRLGHIETGAAPGAAT